MASEKFIPFPRQEIDSSTVTSSYQVVGDVFSFPPRLLRIVNDSDADVEISYDGVVDHDYLRSGETLVLDIQANCQTQFGGAMPKYLGVFVKGTAGTGNIYVAIYGQEAP